jgi:5-methylcytosine-specific restriction endonuclease McrA
METLTEPVPGVRGWASPRGRGAACAQPAVRSIGARVLVLNASFEPINVCTVRRAAVLLLKSRAELLEHSDEELHSELLAFPRPLVIRLIAYVRIPRDVHRRKITRKAVLARDAWTCQYCGSKRSGLTVDHVIPRSRGGESVWENIVAACAPCNRRKGNRLPVEIEMHPSSTPKAPGPTVFIRVAAPTVPASWEPYLGGVGELEGAAA